MQNASSQQQAIEDSGRRLRMLDRAGHIIQSPLNYGPMRSAELQALVLKEALTKGAIAVSNSSALNLGL